MSSHSEIDLEGLLPPICLLECKKYLNEMEKGDVVCVSLKDAETVKDLGLIVSRSKDKILKQHKKEGLYRIYIQKG